MPRDYRQSPAAPPATTQVSRAPPRSSRSAGPAVPAHAARSPALGACAGRPTTASRKLGAGALPVRPMGMYGQKPIPSSHSVAASSVSRASPSWLQRASRAELSCSAFNGSFFRWLQVGANAGPSSVRIATARCAEMRAESLLKNTVGRWDAHADSWSDAPFLPVPPATTPFFPSPAAYGF